MIVGAPRILSDEWMLIGRQEATGTGRLPLLAIAPDGALVLIELKRDRTPREVVAHKSIPSNVPCFQVFTLGSQQLLSRTWLMDPVQVQVNEIGMFVRRGLLVVSVPDAECNQSAAV